VLSRNTIRRRLPGMTDDRPDWEPLLALVGEPMVCEFMWMTEIALPDGRALQSYKHIVTRRYLHLTADSQALGRAATGRWCAVDTDEALRVARDDDAR
jgi:hypothetical protein